MSESDETIVLLREIRDLQRAHFEQYRLFTSSAMEQQKKNMAAFEQTQLENARFRERQLLVQDETSKALARGRAMIVVGAIIQGLIVGAIAYLAVLGALRR